MHKNRLRSGLRPQPVRRASLRWLSRAFGVRRLNAYVASTGATTVLQEGIQGTVAADAPY
jgi:hypothetical protein